jgi:general secretion pathway protein G
MKGFTLVEMLVTVALVALLASVTVPLLQVGFQRNEEQDLKLALREIRTSLDAYKKAVDEGFILKKLNDSGYPPNLEILVTGVVNVKDPNGKKIFFLRRIPRDPMNSNTALPAVATWGLRSYASEADAPYEGADVYDVYSRSQRIGLNGTPYREW